MKYNSYKEWRIANPSEADKAKRNGWVNEICDSNGWNRPYKYKEKRVPNGYWTIKEHCLESARKCKTVKVWRKKFSAAVDSAIKNDWYEECTKHMGIIGPATKEECILEAKKYTGRWEWQKKDSRRYNRAKVKGWLDECCTHMVGNKRQGYWTKEKCREYSIKYNYPSDWENGHRASHSAARAKGWYQELSAHMDFKIKPRGYWNNKQRCIDFIKTCTSKEDLKRKSPSVSGAIRRNGWYKELTTHFEPQNFKWTKEELRKEAKKYKTTKEFSKGSNGAYQVACKNGWLNYVTKDLIKPSTKPSGYWNDKERCIEEARKYTTKSDFIKYGSSAVFNARKNGWYEECTAHMK